MQEDVILDTLGLSHQYGFTELESSIGDYLREILQIRNVCGIFDSGRLYELQFLTKVCTTFMDMNARDVIHHESFKQLSPVSSFFYEWFKTDVIGTIILEMQFAFLRVVLLRAYS